ncbi:MAG TPA: hypothetical protein VMU95_38180 [Trebonia sp.]|nr:hypothetical protein [Trebonia sp.]
MNISRQGPHARVAAAVMTGVIALPVVTGHGHGGATPAPKVPGLAISISDGRQNARPGQVLTYTASLHNTGTAAIPKLEVTEMLSAGLKVTGASDQAAVKSGQVAWSTALPAAGTRQFTVTAEVTKTPAQLLRLAAVACVTLPGHRQPAVCAAHLDRLPAIAIAAAPARRPGLAGSLPLVAAALALLACCLLALLLIWRRRLKHRPSFHAAAK